MDGNDVGVNERLGSQLSGEIEDWLVTIIEEGEDFEGTLLIV